jgi:type I restriction enzyme, S subunit
MIDGLKPYAAMKDSGVTWLGKVPSHWPVLPNRALFMEVKDRNHPEEEMLSVTITQGIVRQKTILADSSKKDSSNQDKSAYKLVKPRDLAYNKMRAWQGAIGVSDLRGIISPAYVVMRPHESYCPRYFHYLYRTPHFAKEAERWSYGITSDMWSLRPEHFKMIYTSVPTREEQSAIVRFLDRADRRIRRYKLLEEQRQAIIHRAVTRGLDPNVRIKNSGVEWLGDVPEHWDVVPLRWHIAIGSGDFIPTEAASDLPDANHAIPVIGGNGVMGYCKRYNSDGTTIVIGRAGALCRNVHLVEGHAWADNALRITRMRGFEPEYFVLQLQFE